MSISKVALIGATGNLGPAILKGLLDGGYQVTILSREGSNSTNSLASHPNQKIQKVDFENVNSITQALEGIEGVVSNVASTALMSQTKIVDAAVAAGVKRFIPSDFGSDMNNEAATKIPFNQPKVEIHKYVEEKAKAHSEFSYTYVYPGPFFDWCLKMGIFGDLKSHDITLWNGGNTKISTSTLATVGRGVAAVFKNFEATKNKEVRFADTTISQKEIMAIAKEIDGKEWTTKEGSTDEAYQTSLEEMKKSNPDFMVIVMNQLYKLIFSAELGPNMEGKLDNDKLGLSKMTSEQVKETIKSSMA